MSGFDEYKLGDLLTFQRGFDITKSEQKEGEVPIVSSSGISSFHNQPKSSAPGVVIGRKGSLGTVHYLKINYWPHDTTLWVKDFKGNEPGFIYYFLQTLHLENFDVGSSNPTLNRNHLHKIRVLFPKEQQKKIAAVLSAYDDLIDNNRRRIELLERMAEELYREWFVRFRFPGYQQVKFERTVPQGWEPQKLGDLCHLIKRGITPKYSDDSPRLVINQRCIRNGGVDLSAARQHDTKAPAEKIIQHADALINSTGVGTLGRVSIVEFEPDNLTCDTHVTICRANPKKVNPYFLACTVARLQQHFENLAVGSTGQTELGREEIAKVKILLPPEDLQTEFAKRISSFWIIKTALADTLRNLAEQRDQLLTRLISGKLPVDQLDIQFPPACARPTRPDRK